MKKLLITAVLILLYVPQSAYSQAANWCGSGTAQSNDPLNASYFSGGSTTGTTTSLGIMDSMAKVLQNSTTVPTVKTIYPCVPKNGTVSFQVFYVNTSGSSFTLNAVTVGNLVQSAPNSFTIPSSAVLVHAERYYQVNTASDDDSTHNTGTGPVPDPLVPTVEPYYGQTTNAFPVAIANNKTQGFWLDINVPANAPSGYYSGTLTVTNSVPATVATLPIVLAVWNYSIPSKTTLLTEWGADGTNGCLAYYGSYASCGSFPPASASADAGVTLTNLDVAYLFADNRTSFAHELVYPTVHSPNSWTTFDANYGPLINGTSTHTQLSGAGLSLISLGDADNDGTDAQYRVTHFHNTYSDSALFDYTQDEPGTNVGPWTAAAARAAINDMASPVHRSLITTDIACSTANYASSTPIPNDYINIMVALVTDFDPSNTDCGIGSAPYTPYLQRSMFNTWLSGTAPRALFLYNGCSTHNSCSNSQMPGTPGIGGHARNYASYMIDASSVRNSMMPWIAYLRQASGLLYYDWGYCWIVSPGPPCQDGLGNTGSDAWVYQTVFAGNGDGTFIYPGTNAKIGVSTPVPVASIRLKLQRDAMQDYEAMNLLHNDGQDSFITTEFGLFSFSTEFTFNNGNLTTDVIGCTTCLMAARNGMGNKLHQLSLPPVNNVQPGGLLIFVENKL